jgi:RND family efflux transporter MFP subunit
MKQMKRVLGGGIVVCSLALCALVPPACRRKDIPYTPPPPGVTVAKPISREVIDWDEYTGRLQAVDSVDLRARVTGFIVDAPFKEGAIVKKGDVLFVIDVRPFQAELDKANADLKKSQAELEYATADFRRLEGLRPTGDASELEYTQALQTMRRAEADVDSAKAAIATATLNLEWCHVTAPISGRVSSKYITVGNLVTGGVGSATLLTTIVSIDPIYCYMDVDERSVLKYQQLRAQRTRVSARDAPIPIFMALADDTGYPHEGVIDFVDNRIDPNTGTMRARGVFENGAGYLVPGFYASVRVPGSGRYDTLLVPDSAIQVRQDEKFLLVTDAQDTVQSRPVKTGALFGELRSIVAGIGPDDRVILRGFQRARPGTKVEVKETTLAAPAEILLPPSATTQELPKVPRIHSPDSPPSAPTTAGSGSP